eukprot:tig00020902_g14987.t1
MLSEQKDGIQDAKDASSNAEKSADEPSNLAAAPVRLQLASEQPDLWGWALGVPFGVKSESVENETGPPLAPPHAAGPGPPQPPFPPWAATLAQAQALQFPLLAPGGASDADPMAAVAAAAAAAVMAAGASIARRASSDPTSPMPAALPAVPSRGNLAERSPSFSSSSSSSRPSAVLGPSPAPLAAASSADEAAGAAAVAPWLVADGGSIAAAALRLAARLSAQSTIGVPASSSAPLPVPFDFSSFPPGSLPAAAAPRASRELPRPSQSASASASGPPHGGLSGSGGSGSDPDTRGAPLAAGGSGGGLRLRRPRNAFMIFSNEHRRRLADEHPGMLNVHVSKILGQVPAGRAGRPAGARALAPAPRPPRPAPPRPGPLSSVPAVRPRPAPPHPPRPAPPRPPRPALFGAGRPAPPILDRLCFDPAGSARWLARPRGEPPMWKSLPEAERGRYRALEMVEKDAFRRLYPNYKFKNQKRNKKKRKAKDAGDSDGGGDAEGASSPSPDPGSSAGRQGGTGTALQPIAKAAPPPAPAPPAAPSAAPEAPLNLPSLVGLIPLSDYPGAHPSDGHPPGWPYLPVPPLPSPFPSLPSLGLLDPSFASEEPNLPEYPPRDRQE